MGNQGAQFTRIPRSLSFWLMLIAAAGVAAGVGILTAFVTRDTGPQSYFSEAQAAMIASDGPPMQWLLADGPIKPGGETLRSEIWMYGLAGQVPGVYVRWLNGVEINRGTFEKAGAERPRDLASPALFHRDMELRDVREVLGESGVPIPDFDSPYDSHDFVEAFVFEEAGLVISFRNGYFFTAQTF